MEIIILIIALALVFEYTNGFHDAANVVSTVIATRALMPLTAIIMAGALNMLGASHSGGVAETITSGLIDAALVSQKMILATTIGAISWNLITWYFGMPSSSSYALIGGLVGGAWQAAGTGAIIWKGLIGKVILPMIFSPLIGFALAYLLMKLLFHFFHGKEGKHAKTFRHLQIGSAGLVALSHGLNDAQKTMGLITLGLFASGMATTLHIPFWVVITCAIVMGLGTASGGFRIIKTMGYSITHLEPIQGFAAEMSASVIILCASFLGMPISSTHMIAGSITGVGTAKRLSAVKWMVANRLLIAWVFTLPGAGLVSAASYKLLSLIGL